MKKLLAAILALTLSLSLAVPALAAEAPEEEAPMTIAAYDEDGEDSPYDRGWSDGYDAAYDKAFQQGKADVDKGLSPKGPPLPEDGQSGETYDAGRADGAKWGTYWGYQQGYFCHYTEGYASTYDKAYDEGLAAGQADGKAGAPSNPFETVPPVEEGKYLTTSYEYGCEMGKFEGYETGYSDGYYDVTGRDYSDDMAIAGKGGVPGRVNVMFDGEMIAFPDQAPELRKGRTMVPVRAVMEGMGAEVEYHAENKGVTITLNDAVVDFTIGSDTYTIFTGGETTTEKMDCACYLKSGRTMVPVRFLAEASNYTVLWNGDRRTVVIVDDQRLMKEIDQSFQEINEILRARLVAMRDRKTQETTEFTLNLTCYDEAGKSAVLPFSGTAVTYTDGTAFRVDLTLNAKEALRALAKTDLELPGQSRLSLKTLLKTNPANLTATLLLDRNGGLYLRAPVLLELLNGVPMEDNQWLALGDPAQAGVDMTELTQGPVTIGILLVNSLLQDPETAFFLDEVLDMTLPMLEAVFGDSHVEKKGDACTWTMDLSSLLASLGAETPVTGLDLEGIEATGSFTADPRGNYNISGDLKLESVLTGALRASGTETAGKLTFRLAMDGLFDLSLTAESTVKTVTTLPSLALPAGAEILQADMAEAE